jgi:hypothetical protein
LGDGADLDNPAILHRDISSSSRAAGAIDHLRRPDDEIEH